MPIQYKGIVDEHNAVRNQVGVFDVSHMGEVVVTGNEAEKFVNHIFTNDINTAARCVRELEFGETYINRFHFEAIQGFHAGVKKSGIGGADGKHGVEEYLRTHVTYMQTR